MGRYGILDDFGDVVRWVWDKPARHYRYVTRKMKRKPAVDWANFEPALF